MIERIQGLPEQVLGLRAEGAITAEDYQTVLVPALEEILRQHRKIRLLYVLDDAFDGYTGGAAWEDAKVGMKHFTHFERVAVVTNESWIVNMVKAFGFAMPGEVRVFGNEQTDEARAWISEPADASTFSYELDRDAGTLVVRPGGKLEAADFERLATEVDPYIQETGDLRGLLILTEQFPGWDDFAALSSHLRFVKDHHKRVKRVAVVTDARIMALLPRIGTHFVSAELKAFPMSDEAAARAWIREG